MPQNINQTAVAERQAACYATPIVDADTSRIDDDGYKRYYSPANADQQDPEMEYLLGIDPAKDDLHLSDKQLHALSRFLPSLLCGEESAVVIFGHESKRMSKKAQDVIAASMAQLSLEEERHEIMLRRLADWLPVPGDIGDIHERAGGFFMKLGFASTSPEDRLAHISALDTCVSLTLGALVKRSDMTRSEPFMRIVNRIRSDESRHVRMCRKHLTELGVSDTQMEGAGKTVRGMFVDLMEPIADTFEDVGMDPDRLFSTLRTRTKL